MATNNPDEQIKLVFSRLIDDFGFVLNTKQEGAVKVITLKNEYLKISLVEEYQPRGIYNVTFYDGKDLWLGLTTLYEFKGRPYNYELGCIKPEEFREVADFLADNYADLFQGDEATKEALLDFYRKQSEGFV